VGNNTMPSFSTGLSIAAISKIKLTMSAINDAVLVKLKLKPSFSLKIRAM